MQYVGSPMKTLRDVKSSDECCVACKKAGGICDRWSFLPGKYQKCELFSKSNSAVYKKKSNYRISGYASWRLKCVV